MVKSFQKSGMLMLAILGMILLAGAVAFFHPLTRGPSSGAPTVGRAVEYDASRGDNVTDRFGDGTPDFLRLDSPEDRHSFPRWFAVIGEYQALRPDNELPAEINDCAALIRYAYRNAMHAHDEAWFQETRIRPPDALASVEKDGYPHTPLGAALFRVKPGIYLPVDERNGAFAEFADAKTLRSLNMFLVSRDVRQARPRDVLFYFQLEQYLPFHSMIFIVRISSTVDGESLQVNDIVVYHTGPMGKKPREMRRVRGEELLHHP